LTACTTGKRVIDFRPVLVGELYGPLQDAARFSGLDCGDLAPL
jgi:hypothetical protein